MSTCLNNYEEKDIEKFFAESEESLKKCNKCPYLVYEDGTITCSLINKEE